MRHEYCYAFIYLTKFKIVFFKFHSFFKTEKGDGATLGCSESWFYPTPPSGLALASSSTAAVVRPRVFVSLNQNKPGRIVVTI